MKNFTEEQLEVLNLTEGQHLVIAPPGSGKTEILASRVINAIESGLTKDEMICLTFTNRAARGMKERIEKINPESDIIVGNIHNYCSRFLFENKLIPLNSSILDEEDSELLMKESRDEYNYNPKDFKGRSLISNAELIKLNTAIKQARLGIYKELIDFPKIEFQNINLAQKVCINYQSLKTEFNYLDYDDILTDSYVFFKNREKNYKLSKFKWIQVDESQDLNPLQFAIINLITFVSSHKVFFADYEQSIFGFMGCKIKTLKNIERNCTVHYFTKNFRSPSYLLDIFVQFANVWLSPNWIIPPIPNLDIKLEKDCLGIQFVSGNNINEAQNIGTNIVPNLVRKSNGSTAIITRTNKSADFISDSLNIEHFKVSGFDLFRRKFIKDSLAYLTCLNNKYDKNSWTRMFYLYACSTLKESRNIVKEIFNSGLLPNDFLDEEKFNGFIDIIENYEKQDFVVFDTETTGLNSETNDIIQIAGIKISKGEIIDEIEIYLKTNLDLQFTTNIHGITPDILNQKGFERNEGLFKFKEFINNSILIGHNVEFDLNFLRKNFKKDCNIDFDNISLDTMEITKRLYPSLHTYALKDLLEYFSLEGQNTHNAVDDVKATLNLLKKIVEDFKLRIPLQKIIIEQNENIIKKFKKGFNDLWNLNIINNEIDISLKDIIKEFLDYNIQRINGFEVLPKELEKWYSHIDRYCKILPRNEVISKYTKEYKSYKEADLITGDENIVVSTVHKAKGLEFENVIVSECVDGVYPHFSEENITEDARTLYVAMTRAKKRLFITGHNVNLFGFSCKRSRFLNCIEKYFKNI